MFLPSSPLPKAVPAVGRFRPPLTPFSIRFLPYPPRAKRASQKPWLQRRPSYSRLIYPGVLHRRGPLPRPPVRLSVSALRGTPAPPSLTMRQRTATATGDALPLHIMDSGPVGPLGHLPDEVQPRRKSHWRGRLRPPPRPLLLPNRRSARCHYRPTATTQSLYGNSSLTAHAFSW